MVDLQAKAFKRTISCVENSLGRLACANSAALLFASGVVLI